MSRVPVKSMLALVALLAAAGLARADWITLQLDASKFGHLENETDEEGKGKCAATSIINSLVWLQNKYPLVYDSKLVPGGDLDAARDNLHNRIKAGGDLGAENIWEQKIRYVEDKVSGKTLYKGMVSPEEDIGSWEHKNWLTNQNPSWSWLWREIFHEEDVEIGIVYGVSGGHALTLTSMKYNDSAPKNGRYDPGEPRKIDFIDSNDPDGPANDNQPYEADLNATGDILQFTYSGQLATIYWAYSESPEPATLSLLAMGSLIVLRRRRA